LPPGASGSTPRPTSLCRLECYVNSVRIDSFAAHCIWRSPCISISPLARCERLTYCFKVFLWWCVTAKFNQSVRHFLPRALKHNFLTAWQLEADRLKRKGLKAFSVHNELIWWYAISGLFALSFFLLWGWMGALFFLLVGFVAGSTLEVINYVEHYGLHRRTAVTRTIS